ncbi:MAG: alpha-amylase family glycosyl hydrolase [Ruthenibacterium sp.]
MWYDESVFYQIYPLGLCGAPPQNDSVQTSRILRIKEWIPHLQKLGANAVYFSPLFESDAHGYDTRDFAKLDCRLGTNEEFAEVCRALHSADIRVVLDGVFNHVGRGFWAFRDVQEKRQNSSYKDWFNLSFDGDSNYGDGFWYEGWEGHYELVKLNLHNNDVVEYLFSCIRGWTEQFAIDGLRLDVAYCLDEAFVRRLHDFTAALKPDFFLVGEMLHGDYKRLVNDSMLHSATNYECYKGLYSSFNSMNLFEIGHSLNRQFGSEAWALYQGQHLLSFLDNHDVSRIASILQNKEHLSPLYALLFAMPGIPCLYYGSEWGLEGDKHSGDDALRPALETPQWNDLTSWIAHCIAARKASRALQYGSYRTVLLTNRQFIFERAVDGERVLVAINADSEPFDAHFDAQSGCADELITGAYHDFGGGSALAPYSASYWRTK